jgi:hypothetical protein
LYSSPNIIKYQIVFSKIKDAKLGGAYLGETIHAYKILVAKNERDLSANGRIILKWVFES